MSRRSPETEAREIRGGSSNEAIELSQEFYSEPELDELVRRLNRAARTEGDAPDEPAAEPAAAATSDRAAPVAVRWPLVPPSDDGREWIGHLIGEARELQASDVLLVVGTPPTARVNGRLQALGKKPLSADGTAVLAAALVPEDRRRAVQEAGTLDFSLRLTGSRLRCNLHRERGHWSAAVRLLPDSALDLGELQLPDALSRFAGLEYGLVLVTGPTGCGKSTTLAALTRQILSRRRVHLITIEDPVEYEHAHGDSVVEHIEIGRDVATYAQALRAALRQDPDVLLIGEMRDPESISIAITAAETGHLVLSTLHTGDAPQTVHRILDSYPAKQMDVVRVQLSISLAGIVSQQLLPRSDGKGRVPAVEILVATRAVRNLVRQGKIQLLRSQIALEQSSGMLSLDASLARLVRGGLVDEAEARSRARVPEEFDTLLKRRRP